MELRDYLRVARRQWWVMAVAVLIALGVTQVINRRTPPRYAATDVFFMSTTGKDGAPSLEGSMFISSRMKTYTELLTGDWVATEIARSTKCGLTYLEIKERITVDTSGDSALLKVTVVDGRPERARMIASAVLDLFPVAASQR